MLGEVNKNSGFLRVIVIITLIAIIPMKLYSASPQGYETYIDSLEQADTHIQKEFFAREALKQSKRNSDKKGLILSYYHLGKLANEKGNTSEAKDFYKKAVDLVEDYPDILSPREQANLYKSYAENFSLKSSYRKALKYFLKSNRLAKEHDFKEIEMHTSRKIGNVYYHLDDFDKSSQYYYQSLSIARNIDNPRGISYALNNIASNLSATNELDEALEMYKKGMKIARDNNFAEAIGYFSNNIGDIYLQKGDKESALDYFSMGLSYANKNNNFESLAAYYNNIAGVYVEKEEYDKAREFFRKSHKYYNKIGNKRGLARFYLNYANLNIESGKLDSVNTYLQKAADINKQLNSLPIESNFYQTRHKYYTKVDSFAKALRCYKKHKSLEDSISNSRTKEKISSLNEVYAEQEHQMQLNKLKEKQDDLQLYLYLVVILSVVVISSIIYAFFVQRKWNRRLKNQNIRFKSQQRELAQKNRELYESQKKLEEVDKDRNQLFSIISHDLRSPFNSLLGFSEMLLEEVREGQDLESIEMMTENIYKSSMQLFELIQNLLEWANSERGKIQFKPEKVILRKVTDENVNLAKHTAQQKGVNIINDINRSISVEADMNMLNTILRNLIFNSVKFTSKDGYVRITAEDRKKDVKVYIEDNGMGMTKEEKDRILFSEDTFSKEGTNKEKGAGLGLVLVKSFLKKHKGELDIDSTLNKGTTFSFTIPKNNAS